MAILVAGVAVAGIMMLNHRQASEARRQEEESRRMAFERSQIEEKQRREREEKEQRRQAELRQEKQRKRQEKEAADAKVAEERAAREASRKRRESLRQIVDGARKLAYDYWRNCPPEERPGKVTQSKEYYCIIPKNAKDVRLLRIVAEPGKDLSCETFDEDANPQSMTADEFKAVLSTSPYLILTGGKGWVCGVDSDKDGVPVTGNGSMMNPSSRELGPVYDYLLESRAKLESATYGVYFADSKGKRYFVKRIGFGETVSAGDVKPIVRAVLQEKADKKKNGKKTTAPYKRTVVFGNVTQIKKAVGGPTVIPYVMPAYKGYGVDYKNGWCWRGGVYNQTWSRKSTNSEGTREREYLTLRVIAEKEDAEEAAWRRRQVEGIEHFEIPESEVEKVVFSGRLFYLAEH